MPNWKYPCIVCDKPVKTNQKGIECNTCNKWVHLKCTNLTQPQYTFLEQHENEPFNCLTCNPDWGCTIPDNPSLDHITPLPLSTDIETNLNYS